MNTLRNSSLILLAFLALPAAAAESGALVTRLQGKVGVAPGGQSMQSLAAFYRLKAEDRLELAEGATLQLVFLQNGRQENWRGPLTLVTGSDASRCQPAPCQAEVKQLPAAVLATLSRTPTVFNNIRNRSGMVLVRSSGESDEQREAQATYRQLREQADNDDITPELYLLTRLYQLRLYREIPKVLEDMQARQPDNPELQVAQRQFNTQLQEQQRRRRARLEE